MLVEFQWVNSRSQRKFEDEIEDWRSGEGRRQKGKIPMPPCKGEFIGRSLWVIIPTLSLECHSLNLGFKVPRYFPDPCGRTIRLFPTPTAGGFIRP